LEEDMGVDFRGIAEYRGYYSKVMENYYFEFYYCTFVVIKIAIVRG
jgi:hypothetical protein